MTDGERDLAMTESARGARKGAPHGAFYFSNTIL